MKNFNSADKEIAEGRRFAFGENWSEFLGSLNDERIERAKDDLKKMLRVRH